MTFHEKGKRIKVEPMPKPEKAPVKEPAQPKPEKVPEKV